MGILDLVPFSDGVGQEAIDEIVGRRENYNWLAATFLAWMSQAESDRQSLYNTYRDYYDGQHKYQLTDRMKEFLELDPNIKFDLNYLPPAIDVLNERLSILGFSAREESGLGGSQGLLAEWWKAGDIDVLQKDIHLSSLRDGDSYVLVGWDNEEGEPIVTHEMAYDGESGMSVRYYDEGRPRIRLALKRWVVSEGEPDQRMNVYLEDAIYKFITGNSGWEPYMEVGEDGQAEEWPMPWVDPATGLGLGVPVVHFKNKGGGYHYGKSEIHDLIPAQDALNKAVLDELAGADIEGFGIITLSGGRPPEDDTDIGPRRILWSPDGKWDTIKSGDIRSLSELVHNYVVRIAQLSRTPLQYFQSTRQIASSETQKAYDTGIISKAEDRGLFFGKSWEQAMKIALRLDNVFGGGNHSDEDIDSIKAVWASFDRVDRLDTEKRRADIVVRLVEGGASLKGALIVAGYTNEEINGLLEGAPLISPIFMKAGGVGRSAQNLLTDDTEGREFEGGQQDATGQVASSTATSGR